MILIGSFVKFTWWSNYIAPSAFENDTGHHTWHEIHPGMTGVILSACDQSTPGEFYVVLFSGIDVPLKLHRSMLNLA